MSLAQSNRSALIGIIENALRDPSARPHAVPALRALLASVRPPTHIIHDACSMRLLSAAAASGWDAAVHILLAAGADVQADHDDALCAAARGGHVHIMDALLAAGADVHALVDLPLLMAAGTDHVPAVECLLAAGARVRGYETLQQAVVHGNITIVDLLLAATPDNRLYWHSLACDAVKHGQWDMIGHLIMIGADPHADDEHLLRLALIHGGPRRADIVRLLLCHGADAVRAWRRLDAPYKTFAAAVLDAMASDIPHGQRDALASAFPHRFPAMGGLLAAEQRRHQQRRAVTDRPHEDPVNCSGTRRSPR